MLLSHEALTIVLETAVARLGREPVVHEASAVEREQTGNPSSVEEA